MTPGAPDAAPDPRAEAVRAFGRYLLRERELRGLSPDDVSRVTRLAPAVIDSIEAGDPERMPPRGYLVGYLRSYAGAVGLDADDVVLRYQEAAGAEDPEPATGPVRAGGRTIRAASSRWAPLGGDRRPGGHAHGCRGGHRLPARGQRRGRDPWTEVLGARALPGAGRAVGLA